MGTLRDRMVKVMQLRGLSPKTQAMYVQVVVSLTKRYGRSPATLTPQEVQDFLLERHERGLAQSTLKMEASAIRFLFSRALARQDVTLWLPPARRPQRLPEVLNAEELSRLFDATASLKERVLLMLVYGTGLRAGEAARLKVSDLDTVRGLVRVEQGKRSKDRYTLLPSTLIQPLRCYWATHRSPTHLFPSPAKPGFPIGPEVVGRIYRKAKKKAGIGKSGGVHALRHTFATDLLEAGASLLVIRDYLGHTGLKTTMRYLRISPSLGSRVTSPLDRLSARLVPPPPPR